MKLLIMKYTCYWMMRSNSCFCKPTACVVVSKFPTILYIIYMEKEQYCWPKALFIKPPRVVLFEASCKLHDEGYNEGWNELRRLICDLFFYTYMLNDINKVISFRLDSNESRIKINLTKTFYFLWASLYFVLVRLFGWWYFNYKNK
jgi:hypothetical protein